MNTIQSLIITIASLAALPFYVQAQVYTGIDDAMPVQIHLDGNIKYDGWYNLTVQPKVRNVWGTEHTITGLSGYPTTFTSAAAYPNPIWSQLQSHSGNKAAFNKVANGNGSGGLDKFNADGTRNATTWGGSGFGPYPAGDSIYAISFSNNYNARGGTFGIFETAPVNDLQNLVLQIEIGSANGYDFYDSSVSGPLGGIPGGTESLPDVPFGPAATRTIGMLSDFSVWSPTLNLTFEDNSTASLAADFGALLNKGYNGTIPMPTGPGGTDVDEPIWVNLYGFQWDLSAYNDIASFAVTWDVTDHAQIYGAQLDQSDTFNGEVLSNYIAVPEPGTYAAVFGGITVIGFLIHRRRASRFNV